MWRYTGQERPPFADEPGAGQESVWDYPRPPRLEASERRVEIRHRGRTIARSESAWRVLETASPPSWYVPPEDVDRDALRAVGGTSICEWKGVASYWALAEGGSEEPVAWSHEEPRGRFAPIRGCLAFCPGRVECCVGGEPVRPQAGEFHGGWVTEDVAGPFKGKPGSHHR